jgi:hypothetical protein
MAQLIDLIHFFEIGKIVKELTDHVNAAFCLTISLVVVRGNQYEHDLKVLYELLPEVRAELRVFL